MDDQKPVKMTTAGKIIILFVIVAIVLVGLYLARNIIFPKSSQTLSKVDMDKFKKMEVEKVSPQGITTVSEYSYVPSSILPPVKGTSNYKWDSKEKIVKFPINVWIGWLPIVAANHGFKANKESIFYQKYGFQVELTLIDNPITARDAFASGETHVLWGTLDMMVLFTPELMKDSRTAPRIFQQIDWSNGGDGIVSRETITSINDLKGRTIVLAQNSPSEYFLYNLLIFSGIQPSAIKPKYTTDAFQAATAFVAEPSIDACVSWAPDIYNIEKKVKGTKILTTTSQANRVIADVWAMRADFARDHPEVAKGLVAGIFYAMDQLKDPVFLDKAMKWMATGYKMKPEEIKGMLNDAHSTNFAENKDFFLNRNNPTNFENTWNNITLVYKELNRIKGDVTFDKVMDFSIIQQLDKDGIFKHQKDEYVTKHVSTSYSKLQAEKPLLVQTIRISFYPNSANIHEPQHDEFGKPVADTKYDPEADKIIETVGRLAKQYDRATILITGHTDSSMKGTVNPILVQKLSDDRAKAVKEALIKKYKFPPEKFVTKGLGWDQPSNPNDPLNQPLNRRVEISVYPAEQ
ncbi:MAG: OmpA family protein [Candidatus Coatesbacteria bacterium]|nr:OmpA family protein [Candidatus Coatesbacteria bacterium]